MQMEERTLAEGCRNGDGAAQRELYDRYAGRLLALCLRYAGDRATAEDLLHDAFLKIYGAFSKFEYRGAGSLRAWMERVTVNVALEWLRTRNRLGCVELDEGRAAALPDEPSAEEASRVPRDVLMRFVSELPTGTGPYSTSTASKSIRTGRSRRCWESTRKVLRRSFSGRGRCWRGESATI